MKTNILNTPIITIDGPSGTGKGTISQKLAQSLGWHYLDSGAIYRVFAFAAVAEQINFSDIEALIRLAQSLRLSFEVDANLNSRIFLNQKDITHGIRTEICGQNASKLAAIPDVRLALLERQRAFAVSPGLVTDGRDMGTVVFPQADLKFFLYASVEERAKRRHLQLQNQQHCDTLAQVVSQLEERDARDSQRSHSPLVAAEDAVQIDTTDLSIEEVFNKVLDVVMKRGFRLSLKQKR
jgi:cytidylate kinase